MLLENKQKGIKMTKDELIELLEEDEIQKVIKDIVNNSSETTALSLSNNIEKEDLNKEIDMLNKIIKKIKKALTKEEETSEYLVEGKEALEFELSSIRSEKIELEKNRIELKKTIDFYKNNFEDDLKAYEIYQTLNSSTKSSLDGIFKDSSLQGFIACGIQDRNISSFWDYIQNELRDNTNQDITNLIKIFDFLFSRYIIAYPIFAIQNVNINDKFDTDDYIRDNSSQAVSGNISKIVLRGWINKKTNKIIRKSVVKVG